MIDIGFGLLAAICWGFADFLAKIWGERYGVVNAVLFLHIISVFVLLPFLAFVPDLEGSLFKVVLAALALGLFSPISYWLFYGALAAGKLSINSPIASSSAAISVLLAFVFLRERPALVVIVGMGIVVTGVALINLQPDQDDGLVTWRISRSVLLALGSAVAMGVMFFLIPVALKPLGAIGALLLVRASGTLFLLSVKNRLGFRLPPWKLKVWLPLLILAILDAAGFLAYFTSTTSEYVSIGAALSGTFAAVSAVLGWFLLRERATVLQRFSVVMIVLGVLAISSR